MFDQTEFLKVISRKGVGEFGGDFDKYSNHTKQEIFNYLVEKCQNQNPVILREKWVDVIKSEYNRAGLDLSFLK
jgi:hypothetical protein